MDLNALRNLGYGMYIVSSCKNNQYNGQIANTVFQITSDPATIGISINKKNLTYDYIQSSNIFTLSVLNIYANFKFIGLFGFRSGRDVNKFKNISYELRPFGTPVVLDYTCSWLECKVINAMDCGTHTLFLGQLVDCNMINDIKPMTYDYYHKVIKGKSPKTAPTYMAEK